MDSIEVEDSYEEEYDEFWSESGSFGICGTRLGGLSNKVAFTAGVNSVGGDWPFDGDEGSFFRNMVCVT